MPIRIIDESPQPMPHHINLRSGDLPGIPGADAILAAVTEGSASARIALLPLRLRESAILLDPVSPAAFFLGDRIIAFIEHGDDGQVRVQVSEALAPATERLVAAIAAMAKRSYGWDTSSEFVVWCGAASYRCRLELQDDGSFVATVA